MLARVVACAALLMLSVPAFASVYDLSPPEFYGLLPIFLAYENPLQAFGAALLIGGIFLILAKPCR